jgi:hypothetical protein
MRHYPIRYFVVLSLIVLSISSFAAADRTEYMYCRAYAFVTVHPNYYSDVFSLRFSDDRTHNIRKSWERYLTKEHRFDDSSGSLEKDFHDSRGSELYSTRCYSFLSEQEAVNARAQAIKADREKSRRPPSVETDWTYSADDDQ